jgi:hypothetical protein
MARKIKGGGWRRKRRRFRVRKGEEKEEEKEEEEEKNFTVEAFVGRSLSELCLCLAGAELPFCGKNARNQSCHLDRL